MNKSRTIFRSDVIGWSLYDFANTIFSMNIVSLYFKRWIVEDLHYDGLYYDLAYSFSMLLAGILMPALGAISDQKQKKKLFLFLFTAACCFSLGIIPLVPVNLILVVLICFAISNFFYEGGFVFYNSLLYSVADDKQARVVSGFGVALGYLGAILGVLIVLPFVTGSLYSIDIPWLEGSGKTGSFIPTAILFFVFSIPLFIFVKESKSNLEQKKIGIKQAYKDVIDAIKDTKKYPGVLRFLIADYFFEDAAVTVILNIGIFSSVVLGFSDSDLTTFLIITPISAVVGSYLIGLISKKGNLKNLMTYDIWGWIFILILFIFVEDKILIYIMGSIVGVLLGGLWTLSRPLLAEMVPRNELGKFFGLYSLSGRSAAILGPIVWGVLVYLLDKDRPIGQLMADSFNLSSESSDKLPYRMAVISLILIMAVGLIIFRKLPSDKIRKDPRID